MKQVGTSCGNIIIYNISGKGMVKMYKHIIFITLLSVFTSWCNSSNFCRGDINIFNIIMSVMFLIVLFLYGLLMGRRKNKTFVRCSVLFWGAGILLGFLYHIVEWSFVADMCIWIYRMPVWGFESILNSFPVERGWSLLSSYIIMFIIPLGVSICGYLIKKVK